jgi:YYY domain-containing protein
MKDFLIRRWPALLFAFILLAALGLRLYGINWDQGHFFQPDERSIYMRADCMHRVLTEAPDYQDCLRYHPFDKTEPGFPSFGTFFDAETSPLNPHWFPLGSILIYVLVLIKGALSPIVHMDLRDLAFAGRTIAVLADVASVYMLFILGRKLFNRTVGFLAAGLLAITVTAIQHSHFYRPEPFIVLFVLASMWSMLRVVERGRLRDSALLGLFVGLTFAVKLSVLPLLAPLAIGFGARLFRTPQGTMARPSLGKLCRVAMEAGLAGVVTVAVFLITEPYALIDLPTLIDNLTWEAGIARKAGDVPYTVQYIGTTRYWYDFQQSVVWSMGLPLGLVAWGGLLFTLARFRRLTIGEMLILAWVVPSFLIAGSFEVKFTRYVFPITALLILMGSHLMVWSINRVKEWRPRLKPWVMGAVAFVVAATAFYALAFGGIYSRPHSAVQASEWIFDNLPRNSRILMDNHWDEGVPNLGWFSVEQLPMFEGDNEKKMKNVAEQLARGDYLLFYGKLTYGSIARVPERFPMSSEYYRALFAGELGYEPIKAFTSYPELLEVGFVDDTFTRPGLTEPAAFRESRTAALAFNLGYADNDVVKYDHPKVMLFENTGDFSEAELTRLLAASGDKERRSLLMPPDELRAQREGGTWTEIIRPSGWANRLPALSWLLLVEAISLAALPLTFLVFRRLPDKGLLLAKPLGVLGVSYLAWLLASFKWMAFSRFSVLVGLLAVGFLSALVLRYHWREIVDFLRRKWRLVLLGEVLFLAAFLSFVAIRMANPDLWHPYRGGEKPMDLAYLNAIVRSTYMPPYDPWFAGAHINYYYFGHFIVACFTKTLGMVPEVAYNLAVPLFFALTVGGAFSLAHNITEGVRRRRRKGDEPATGTVTPLPTATGLPGLVEPPMHTPLGIAGPRLQRIGPSWGPVFAGITAAAFVAVLGNLDGIVQVLQGAWEVWGLDRSFPEFDFWRSSRMIPVLENADPSILRFWLPPTPGSPDMGYHITEFPFFTFLFADLHAHLLVIPFTLLALGLLFALLLELRLNGGRRLLLLIAALALTLGALASLNIWDYPPYIVLAIITVACGAWLRGGSLLYRIGVFAAVSAGVVLLSFLAFLPFHLHNETGEVGIEASKWATPIYSYLGMFGLFLVIIGVFLGRRWRTVRKTLSSKYISLATLPVLLGLIWLAGAGYWTAVLIGVMLIPTVLLLFGLLERKEEGAAYAIFPLLLLCMAFLISGGVEFVRMKPDIGRMNTLFKLYLEVWVFLAVVAACALWYLLSRIRRPRSLGSWLGQSAWIGLVVLLIGCSLIYTIGGTRDRLRDRFNLLPLTLDGTAYMEGAVFSQDGHPIDLKWDLAAIEWLERNVQGSPVILEGRTTQYQWGNRVSIYTGLPSILGWEWHQMQQRPEGIYAITGRKSIVDSIYNTTNRSRASDLLKSYSVKYIVVGELERIRYDEKGLDKFDDMLGREMEIAYENEGVKIYRVLPS